MKKKKRKGKLVFYSNFFICIKRFLYQEASLITQWIQPYVSYWKRTNPKCNVAFHGVVYISHGLMLLT